MKRFDQQLFDYMQGCGIYGKDENGIWNRFCDAQPEKGGKGPRCPETLVLVPSL